MQKQTQNGLKTSMSLITVELPEENIGKIFFDINHSNIFFWLCLLRQRKQKQKRKKNEMGPIAQQRKSLTKQKDNLVNGRTG